MFLNKFQNIKYVQNRKSICSVFPNMKKKQQTKIIKLDYKLKSSIWTHQNHCVAFYVIFSRDLVLENI